MDGQSSTGDSYHYQDIDNYVKKNFTGRYNNIEPHMNEARAYMNSMGLEYSFKYKDSDGLRFSYTTETYDVPCTFYFK